jgi:ABC-2 type transport system permease protein
VIAEIFTVVWKELKELPYTRMNMRGGKAGLLIFVAAFGVILPLQFGAGWLESPMSLVYWSWVPFLLVSGVVADAFAGERERRTLETLLASRLSDRAIYIGKLLSAVVYGFGLTLGCVVLGVITINVVNWRGELLFVPGTVAVWVIVIPLLVATLSGSLGVLISLRSATVRQAQQTFSIAFYILFVPMLLLPLLPASVRAALAQFIISLDASSLVGVVALLLLILNAFLIGLGMARFQRARLILD